MYFLTTIEKDYKLAERNLENSEIREHLKTHFEIIIGPTNKLENA